MDRMKDAGFYTVASILMRTKKALCDVKGLSEPKIDKIRDAAMKLVGTGFITGTEVRQRRQNVFHITTGSTALDELIGGGIESGSITEAFGTSHSHSICILSRHARILTLFSSRCMKSFSNIYFSTHTVMFPVSMSKTIHVIYR